MSSLEKNLMEALKLQKEIFGDDLFILKEEKEETIPEPEIKTTEKIEKDLNKNLFEEGFQKAETLEELDSLINTCTKCDLSKSRTKFVFGVGNPEARAMLIGEAPGADEDKQGEPFVGRAGKLLNDILKAINLTRDDVFIANILKCRPPGNRDPLPSEMETCMPYLYKQIELINPKIILCLGRVAANGLLNKKLSLSALRGNVYEFNGIKVVVTYHPAALLRNPGWKKGCWEDVKKFKKLYDELN
ncbi:uracil-DNA glycosylase [Melioribacter sp. Ez-97]|uniref:uracil-DNA glycosylase n=1 Tax=Melioribacter sp. Ez-97 TaxID=3423434 RepID=UPI003ED932DE